MEGRLPTFTSAVLLLSVFTAVFCVPFFSETLDEDTTSLWANALDIHKVEQTSASLILHFARDGRCVLLRRKSFDIIPHQHFVFTAKFNRQRCVLRKPEKFCECIFKIHSELDTSCAQSQQKPAFLKNIMTMITNRSDNLYSFSCYDRVLHSRPDLKKNVSEF